MKVKNVSDDENGSKNKTDQDIRSFENEKRM